MYVKKFNHKICFNYDPEDFLKKSETQRLLDINETPNKFVKELEKRKDKIKEYLESGRDGYAKCNIGGIRGSVGTHSDPTADIAIDRSYYEKIVSDEITFTELMPSLGMLTINALACADSVLIPVQAAYLPVKGLEQLIKTIGRVQRRLNKNLRIEGILLTMVDARTNYARDTPGNLFHFGTDQ